MKKITFLFVLLFPVLAISQGISPLQERKLKTVMMAVSNLYVDSIDDKKVVENTIVSLLKELDPHSAYIPKEEVQRVQEPLKGSFEGIGIQFQMLEDTLFVVQTIAGSPSEKVGILPGDRMIYVENELIAGVKMQNTKIMERLRGPKGSEVNVRILRRGQKELINFKITRDKIPLHTVDASYMIGDRIGYIKINNFGSTTIEEYKKAVDKLKNQGMQSLILSLQGNGGGYLGAAIELGDQFLKSGEMIVYTEGAHQRRQEAKATSRGNFEDGKLIVLIDEYSASASEIVSGAIQDWDRGILVGRRTFGKGLVQREFELPDSSLMRLTVARYYTPTGRSIQKPYKDGVKKYEEELINRYKHGELSNADSIQFPDSLQYKTKHLGRTVYGGGGIMPDVFIPLDTTKYTDYHRKIVALGVMNKTSLQYIEQYRNEFKKKYPTFDKFKKEYAVKDDFLTQLVENAEREDIKYNEEQMEKSKDLIKLQLKALVARDLWDTNEYYRIIDEENEAIKRAVEILQNYGEYEKILSKPKESKKEYKKVSESR
ncbi:S41 family peptidase [Paludibacter sp. 221]|uniref:S41 family peptidase n=1 Tax=Paludibacter sp. 221 TaxID=2302939 RepID=UPI0013D1EF95|nr:S41 family peptidase [Paludibacter sp. 221]NDV46824.1 S41 family peptidase [Paludibacter sp. 221]